jgi:hypothetical protein
MRRKWAVLGLCVLFWRSASATLIVAVYNHGALYIAGDSLWTTTRGGRGGLSADKIFQVSDTCLACISGDCEFQSKATGSNVFSLRDGLLQVCKEASTNGLPMPINVGRIAEVMSNSFIVFRSLVAQATPSYAPCTDLSFGGYDALSGRFFFITTRFSTKGAATDTNYWSPASNNAPVQFIVLGEGNFLTQLFMNRTNAELEKLRTPAFKEVWPNVVADNQLEQNKMAESILDLFRLHKKRAARFNTNEGSIGPPYSVYKITKEGVSVLRRQEY